MSRTYQECLDAIAARIADQRRALTDDKRGGIVDTDTFFSAVVCNKAGGKKEADKIAADMGNGEEEIYAFILHVLGKSYLEQYLEQASVLWREGVPREARKP